MKRISYILKYLFFILFLFSCTEKFPVDLPKNPGRIVIESLISDNPGPYYVRLTKSTDILKVPTDTERWLNEFASPVFNAKVIISSSDGIVDTLKQWHYPSYYPESGDSLLGYYWTKKWTGNVGVRYFLDVYNEGKHYHAEETMLPTISADTCTFEFHKGDPGKFDGYLPIVHIKNSSNPTGYYWSIFSEGKSWYPNFDLFRSGIYSLFPANQITDHFVGLYNLASPKFPYLIQHYFMGSPYGDTCVISIGSLSKTAYYFQASLLKQLVNDGGSFKPAPATPIGNISGDALGLFQVSSVSNYIITKSPEPFK